MSADTDRGRETRCACSACRKGAPCMDAQLAEPDRAQEAPPLSPDCKTMDEAYRYGIHVGYNQGWLDSRADRQEGSTRGDLTGLAMRFELDNRSATAMRRQPGANDDYHRGVADAYARAEAEVRDALQRTPQVEKGEPPRWPPTDEHGSGMPYYIGVLESLAGPKGREAGEAAMKLYARMALDFIDRPAPSAETRERLCERCHVAVTEGVVPLCEVCADHCRAKWYPPAETREETAAVEDGKDFHTLLSELAGTVEGPSDLASEHDHYLYGTPKRNQPASAPIPAATVGTSEPRWPLHLDDDAPAATERDALERLMQSAIVDACGVLDGLAMHSLADRLTSAFDALKEAR